MTSWRSCARPSPSTPRSGRLGGIHLELPDDAVTECLGGPEGLDAGDLERRSTACDPRLNAAQGLEMASDISRMLHRERPGLSGSPSLLVAGGPARAWSQPPPLPLPGDAPSPQEC